MIFGHRSNDLGYTITAPGQILIVQPTAVLKIEGHGADVVSAKQLDHKRSAFSAAVRAR